MTITCKRNMTVYQFVLQFISLQTRQELHEVFTFT